MKKLLSALLALTLLLGGAHAQEDVFAVKATAAPGTVGTPISEYTYAEAASSTLGVRFAYPSHWENVPGRSTICFKEPVEEGDIPARMTIAIKQLSARAKKEKMQNELVSFMKIIFAQYDSYEIGNLSTDTNFMGKTGYSTIYKAIKGEREIRGSVIMACVGTKIYAFHFSADAQDYTDMSTVMQHIRDNIRAYNG